MLQTVILGCPWCGEPCELVLDPAEGEHTRLEDCGVCCSPMEVSVALATDGEWRVSVRRDNE